VGAPIWAMWVKITTRHRHTFRLIHSGFQTLGFQGVFQFTLIGLRFVPHAIFGNCEGVETAFAAVHPRFHRFQGWVVLVTDPVAKVVFRLRIERG